MTIQKKIIGLLILLLLLTACTKKYYGGGSSEPWEAEIARLQEAIAPFADFETAQEAGYDIQATDYRNQMGYHYLHAGILDANFEVERPEVLIYIKGPSGTMELVAVEYGIPIADINNPPPAPEGFTGDHDVWNVDTEFKLWTLHAWVILDNPDGIFTARNPLLP